MVFIWVWVEKYCNWSDHKHKISRFGPLTLWWFRFFIHSDQSEFHLRCKSFSCESDICPYPSKTSMTTVESQSVHYSLCVELPSLINPLNSASKGLFILFSLWLFYPHGDLYVSVCSTSVSLVPTQQNLALKTILHVDQPVSLLMWGKVAAYSLVFWHL